MQLRSGHETHGALTHQDEEALMMELYPTPDPESQRIAAEDIELAVKGIDNDLSLTDEQRLHELHCMLELCAAEHEREAQEYQAAHRHLIEHEARVSVMTTYPDIPEHIFDDWTAFLDTKMGEDRSKMEYSRANTEALLNVIRIVEDLVEKTQIKVADWGKAERVLRESNRFLERHRARFESISEEDGGISQDAFNDFISALQGEHPREHFGLGEFG